MRTARHRRVVAFRTLLRTLLHEVGHHLDYEYLKLADSFHTEGFFRRESSLFHQLLPPADEELARRVAQADAPPGATVASVELVHRPSLFAYRPGRDLPVYRVALTNGSDVYVSRRSGQVQAHVDWIYRLVRVSFFALHMWDLSLGPDPHRSFLLLGAAALLLFLLGISGLLLALCGSTRRRGPTGTAPTRPPA